MISREDFLKISTRSLLWLSGLLGLGGVARFLSYQPAPPPPKRFDVGPEIQYPLGTRTVLPDIPALLIRERDGFIAISMVCTHLGCTVEYQSKAFVCQCHGSRYDGDGNVTKGPALAALTRLKVEQSPDGHVIIVATQA